MLTTIATGQQYIQGGLTHLSDRIAWSMIGKTVKLRLDVNRIKEGIVRAVLVEPNAPKLVVGRGEFNLSQVLTAFPTVINS